MARRLALIVFVMTLFCGVSQAHAQFTWFHVFCDSVKTDFKRNNCWPEPFVCPDRATVRAPFNIMVHNGWQLENTISNYHFDEATGELTVAGQNKVFWIVNQAPEQHRTVYVQMSRDPMVTSQRLQMVQAVAQNFAPAGTVAQVEATIEEPPSWNAEQVGYVNAAFQASAPPPRLPAGNSSLTGGSGGSSSGGGSSR